MKTSEMIAMLEENPKLKFVKSTWKDNANLIVDDNKIVLINSKEGYVFAHGDRVLIHLDIDADWQLVRDPVPVWEAIKAVTEGKSISCENAVCGHGGKFRKCYFHSGESAMICALHGITQGTWYIEDSPNES